MRGFYAIGIEHGKCNMNVGTLWRSANIMGAAFIFTVGRRYKKQATDTLKTWRTIPLLHFDTIEDLTAHMPHDTLLVGVELMDTARPLPEYKHPERAVYLLGAEDHGLSGEAITACNHIVVLPGERSMNVSTAGSIVLYDRYAKSSI